MKILDKIKDLNFYDTLLNLTKDEYTLLEKTYGDKWYKYFFNSYHINTSIYSIKESSVLKNELIQKYSQKWFDEHIISHKLIEKKLIYSYESIIKYDLDIKNKKKMKEAEFSKEIDEFIDYTTTKKLDIKKLFGEKKQKGGYLLNDINEFNISGGFNNLLNNYEQIGGYDDDHIDDPEDDEEIYHDVEEKDDENKKENVEEDEIEVEPDELTEDEELFPSPELEITYRGSLSPDNLIKHPNQRLVSEIEEQDEVQPVAPEHEEESALR
jgi:hypothetical protein